jgi:hypothetical protein
LFLFFFSIPLFAGVDPLKGFHIEAGACVARLSRHHDGKNTNVSVEQVILLSGQTEEGLSGGKLYHISRKNPRMKWGTAFQPHPKASQGDVFWFERVFGTDVASYFGYRTLGPNLKTVPNADQVNSAIRIFNKILRSKGYPSIATRFYSSKKDRVRVMEYLYRFAMEGALPISEGKPSMVHDAAYHVASIAIPKELWDHARLLTKYVLLFVKEVKGVPDFLKFSRLDEIDEGTANLFLSIVGTLNKDNFEGSLHKLAQRGMSPETYLRRHMEPYARIGTVFRQRMEDFMEKYKRSASFRRELSQETLDVLCAQFSENIENIKEAAEEL